MNIRSFFKAIAIATTLLTAASVASVAHAQSPLAEKAEKQKFFMFLKADPLLDTKQAILGLNVGKMLSSKGHDVMILLNSAAVSIADKRHPLILRTGMKDSTLEDSVNGFLKAGGKLIACPTCAKTVGITKDDLRPGITFGNADIVSTGLAEADKILNF